MNKVEKLYLEIKAAEGGEDSRLFVAELATAYLKTAAKCG